MNDNNLKDLIKIPDGLDNAVLNGMERGKNEKKRNSKNNVLRRTVKVAGLVLGITVTAGIINPNLVSAIPGVNKVFESFNTTLFGEPTAKYQESAKYIGQSKVSNGSTITLEEIILDENMVMVALTVESDFLRGYEGKNEGDFFDLNNYILINGETPQSVGSKVRIIDDNKGAVILSANISDLNIGDTANIKVLIRGIGRGHEYHKGKWNFDLDVKKLEGNRIALNEKIEYEGSVLKVKELITSKLTNTLAIEGIDNIKNHQFFSKDYMIKNNNDKYFRVDFVNSSMSNINGEFETKLEIKGDLSNSEYIELMPKNTDNSITKEVDGVQYSILQCTGAKEGEYSEEVVSRPPTEEELKAGYALDKVSYYINIDKEKEFRTLEDLIGTEIKVSDKESVFIKDIETTDKGTKVTFESKGMYDYRNLSQMLILDEEMNDISRREGQAIAAIEDETKGLFSMTLDKIDSNKKYKIAIPMMPEVDEIEPEWKIKINLK